MSLRLKFVLFVALLTVIGVATGGIAYFFISQGIVDERVDAQLESVTVLKEHQIEFFIEEKISEIQRISQDKNFRDIFYEELENAGLGRGKSAGREKIRELLGGRPAEEGFLEFFVLDLAGKVCVSTDPAQEGKIKTERDYFIFGREGSFVQNFYYDLILGMPATTIAVPIKSEEGKTIGVLAGKLDLRKMFKIMQENAGLGETGETYLVNKFNYIVTGEELPKSEGAIYSEGIKDCLRGNSGYRHYYNYRGDKVVGRYKWLPKREVCLLAEIGQSEAFAPLAKTIVYIILASFLIAGVMMLSGVFLFKPVSESLRELRDAAADIGRGKLDARIVARSKDEVGQLAAAFRSMVDNLKKKTTSIDNLNKEIAERERMEEILAESEDRYRTLFEGAQDGIALADVETGRLKDCNQALCRMVERDKAELVGQAQSILHPPEDDVDGLSRTFRQHQAGDGQALEACLFSKSGKLIDVEIHAGRVRLGGREYLLGIFRDITERKRAEDKIKESEEKYMNLVERANDGIVIAQDNVIKFSNSAFAKSLGYEVREVNGIEFARLIPQENRQLLIERHKKRLASEEIPSVYETKLLCKNGEKISVEVNANIIQYMGKLADLVIIRDITERKRAEEKMKMFSDAIDSAFDYFLITDIKGNITYVNESAIRAFGYTPEEFLGLNTAELDADPETAKKIIQNLAATGKWSGEVMNIRKNKEKFHSVLSTFIIKDEEGNSKGMMGILKDITERKRAEGALRGERDKLQKYFDTAGVIISIFDTNGRVLFINKKGCEILGYTPGEIIGQNWFVNFVSPNGRAQAQKIFEKFVSQSVRRVKYFESPVLTKEQQEKNIAWSYAVLDDEQNQIQAILGTGTDITDLKQAEITIKDLQEVDKLKDEFLNIAAHELKTPLTSIVGLSELLKKHRSGSCASQKKYTGIIYDEAIRLKKVVGQILTVTRYESGKVTVVAEKFVLGDYIASLRPTLEMLAKRTKSEIVLALKTGGVSITGDKEKVAELIYNLVDNAVKYGPDGQTIAVSAKKEGQNFIRIAVADQGKGILEEDQKKIFNKFAQLEPSISRTEEGTGLGLYICKLIAEKLGGKIGVESELGKGSTFYFTLPVA